MKIAFLALLLATPAWPATTESEARARAVVDELAARSFPRVHERFTPQMAQALPLEKLEALWTAIVGQVGPLEEIESARPGSVPGSFHVTCRFANARLDVALGFDGDGRLAGLRLLPSEAPPAWSAPDYAAVGSHREITITVGAAPWELPGVLTVPVTAGPFPAIVLVHGSGPHDQDETIGPNKPFKDLALGLASRGIAVLRYPKRTHRYGREIAQQKEPFTVEQETVADARAAVAALEGCPDIDRKRIFVAGHSLGGYLAPRIAAGHSPRMAGLILLAANARPIEDLAVEQLRYLAGGSPAGQKALEEAEDGRRQIQDPQLKPGMTVRFLGVDMPADYFLDLRGYDPAASAARLEIPVLVLQGGRDYQVTMADFAGWKKVLAGKNNTRLKSYPDLNHLFAVGKGKSKPDEYQKEGHVDVTVIDDVATWIKEH